MQRIDLRDLSFELVLEHGYEREQPLEPDLVRRAGDHRRSHVVWFFPCWWNGPPALVKGFIDRVFTPGYAFRYAGSKLPEKLLIGRSARLVSSMDSPRVWQWLVNGSAMEISFTRSTLKFVGFSPVHKNVYYSAHSMDERARERALEEMTRVASVDARRVRARDASLRVRDAVAFTARPQRAFSTRFGRRTGRT